jgi:coenzyme F420 hydrogenase subunit beta
MTIIEILINRLCIGCGFCAGVCPQSAISMKWGSSSTWSPEIDLDKCTECGLCLQVCPNSLQSLKAAGGKSVIAGEMSGLNDRDDNSFFISYVAADDARSLAASGGTASHLLYHLLESGKVAFVVAAIPRMAKIGEPHFETAICRTTEDLNACRSSAYGPLRYDSILREIAREKRPCAITVLPCIQRAIGNLPEKYRQHIRFTVGIICSHNVTDQFGDYMGYRHGLFQRDRFLINYRDKKGIPDANHFNTYFKLMNGREIHTPRMENGFTPAWRNYWFAHECCLYCPDFYNAEADISIKDAWGRLSVDPLGVSLCVVRNEEIKKALHELKSKDLIYLEECEAGVIKDSQNATAIYKQRDFIYRWQQHPALREAAGSLSHQSPGNPTGARDYRRKLRNMRLTKSLFRGSTFPRYLLLIFFSRAIKFLSKANDKRKNFSKLFIQLARSFISYCSVLTKWGIPAKFCDKQSLRILITGGYGYQNVGDEAQLGANIGRWRKLVQGCEIRVFSPNPSYTEQHHNVKSNRAPRIIWFKADRNNDYYSSNRRFQRRFFLVKLRMILSAHMMRMGLPALLCKSSEYALLDKVMKADVLHVSGGGFLTGMTRSRLWENCLLMRLSYLLRTPVILTGQTIGVFQNNTDRRLARWGLEYAKFIYLRDNGGSEAEVNSLGIKGAHVQSTFDDALFCEKADHLEIDNILKSNGINLTRPFITANYHYWGQNDDIKEKTASLFAEACNHLAELSGAQILFIPMSPSDESPERCVIDIMGRKASLLNYNYDYKIARGIIGKSKLMFTMKHHPIIFAYSEGVPVISVALDDYYYRKNKGAMDACGEGGLCIDRNIFFNRDQLLKYVEKAWYQADEKAFKIKNWISEAIKRENEPIIFLSQQIQPPID